VGLLAGPLAWSLQLLVVYALTGFVCHRGWAVTLHLVSLVCFAAALLGVREAWRHRNAGPTDAPASPVVGPAPAATGVAWPLEPVVREGHSLHFMGRLGLLIQSLFALAIVAEWIAVVLLHPCPAPV
jgi:hypothetical protein